MNDTSGTTPPGRSDFGEELETIFGVVSPDRADAVEAEARQLNDRVTTLLAIRESGTSKQRAAADTELEQIRARQLRMKDSLLRGADTIRTLGLLAGGPAPGGVRTARQGIDRD